MKEDDASSGKSAAAARLRQDVPPVRRPLSRRSRPCNESAQPLSCSRKPLTPPP
jgi:hypothetical protein